MKRKVIRILILGISVVCLSGCTKNNNQEDILYKEIDKSGAFKFNIQPVETAYEKIESVPEIPSYAVDNLEAPSSVELTEHTMSRRTYVYNKPDDTSSQLGRLEWGDTIQVIEATADAEWYKISYNGRVAYVTASNVRKEAEDNTATVIPVILPTVSDDTSAEHVHSFAAATCTSPSKCSCGETKGSAIGHDYVGATCSRCYAPNPNYKTPSGSNPTPSDPTPSTPDPTPVDPTPSDPTPSDPTPSDPTPSDPTPSTPDDGGGDTGSGDTGSSED